jgi:hypothetical protein
VRCQIVRTEIRFGLHDTRLKCLPVNMAHENLADQRAGQFRRRSPEKRPREFLKDDLDLLEITSFTVDYFPPGEVLIHWSSRDRGAWCRCVVQPVLANLALECACADTQHSSRLVTTSVERLDRSNRLRLVQLVFEGGSRHPLHPPGPPRRGLERLCEVLRLEHYLACLELHDAHRVYATPVIGDYILGDPEITPADNPPDHKARRLGRVLAAKGLHVVPPADPLPLLWILDDGIVVVDLVFDVLITRSGGGPVAFQGSTDFRIFHLSLPSSGLQCRTFELLSTFLNAVCLQTAHGIEKTSYTLS